MSPENSLDLILFNFSISRYFYFFDHSRFYSQKGLTKGEKYQFRVRAVNKGGISDPSEPTPYTIAKPRKCKTKMKKFYDGCELFIKLL